MREGGEKKRGDERREQNTRRASKTSHKRPQKDERKDPLSETAAKLRSRASRLHLPLPSIRKEEEEEIRKKGRKEGRKAHL